MLFVMRKLIKTGLSFTLFLLISSVSLGQSNSITGIVANEETQERLPGVNIFLDQTTLGTTSDANGKFQLQNLPDGTYTLVFSFVGFNQFQTRIKLPRTSQSPITVLLKPDVIMMDSLIVKDKYPKEWLKKLKKFKDQFLGYTKNADKTTILNPEVLKFDEKDGFFTTYSDVPLKLRNEALGYHIKLHLENFTIYKNNIRHTFASKFSSLEPKNERQKRQWQKERTRAYNGSFRHFLDALTDNKLYKAGFSIKLAKQRVAYLTNAKPQGMESNSEVTIKDPNKLWYYLNLGQINLTFDKDYNFLKVIYYNEVPERSITVARGGSPTQNQISFLELPKGKAVIDVRSAMSIPPNYALKYGYWAWSSRIPEWLPKDYNP